MVKNERGGWPIVIHGEIVGFWSEVVNLDELYTVAGRGI
jgi:hypothetical protein